MSFLDLNGLEHYHNNLVIPKSKLDAEVKRKLFSQTNTYGTDMNDYVTDGRYVLQGTITNAPWSNSYWILVVQETSLAWRMQIATSGGYVYYRFKANSSGTWSDWNYFIGTSTKSCTIGAAQGTLSFRVCGALCHVEIANKLSAGTYTDSDALWTLMPRPTNTVHFLLFAGDDVVLAKILTNGKIVFNNSTTLSADKWLIGSFVYPVN